MPSFLITPSNSLVSCISGGGISTSLLLRFSGTTIWRCLIPVSSVSHIPDVGTTTTWWHGRAGHVYTSPVDDPSEAKESEPLFEISCRNLIDPATATWKRFSWGVPATNERVESHFTASTFYSTL